MTRPSWMALHSMACSVIELHKAVIHVIILVFCDCGFQSVYLLMPEDKRLVQASLWEGLAVGKTGSCSGGQGHAQQIFNPVFCWWVGLCSLPVGCLAWSDPILESTGSLVGLMVNSKRVYANTHLPGRLRPVPLFLQQLTADPCPCKTASNTHRRRWVHILLTAILEQDSRTGLPQAKL